MKTVWILCNAGMVVRVFDSKEKAEDIQNLLKSETPVETYTIIEAKVY